MSPTKQFKIILSLASIMTVIIIIMLAFGVNKAFDQQTILLEDDKLKVGIITNDSIYDQSWGSLAYNGKMLITENYPVEVELIADRRTKEEVYWATKSLIEQGMTLIIGHGVEFASIFSEMAPQFPDVSFVTLNGEALHPNQSSFWFNYRSPDYFAGMVAALMTKSNKVGIIDTFGEHVREIPGFSVGVKDNNPDAEVYSRIVGSRDNEELAALFAKELIALGVDVIFSRGNAYNRAVIHEVEQANIYAIGFVDDQAYMAANHVLTSIINDVPQAYVIILEQYFSKDGLQPGETVLDFKDGVYKLAPFGEMVPEWVQKRVQTRIAEYNRGEINFDVLE